jgi:hypothetical protein
VAGEYVLRPGTRDGHGAAVCQVAFQVAPYDRMLALVIDPVLACSTYLGGGITDTAYGIAVDAAGSANVTGQTFSRSSYNGTPAPGNPFPTTTTASNRTFSVIGAAYVAKLNADGSALVFSTFLGGNKEEIQGIRQGLGLDAESNIYVAGQTRSANFPITHAVQTLPRG